MWRVAAVAAESAQNLNSRSLTVTDHGIQAMPRRGAAAERVEDHWPRFLGQSSALAGAPGIDESLSPAYARARES